MRRPGRPARALLALVGLLALLTVANPAFATDEGETTDTTVPASGTTIPLEQIDPAVPVQPPPENPTTLDWTYRYMIPTALVIAVAVVLLTSIRYFTNVVRKRYRIVEE
jgi:hypothetical protein